MTPCRRWSPCANAVSTLSEYCLFFMSACTWASLAPVSAKMAWSLLMRSPWGVSYTVVLVMVTADIAIE